MARTFTASTEAPVRPLPCLLQRSVVDDGDSFIIENLACSWRGEELVVGLPDLPAGWLDCLPLVGGVRWVDSPLIEALWKVSEHVRVCFRLVVEADGEAVHEGVVANRLGRESGLNHGVDLCTQLP